MCSDRPLFVYGSLGITVVQRALLAKSLVGQDAWLPGFALRRYGDRPYPAVWEDPTSSVKGQILIISPNDWPLLDAWEEAPQLYVRQEAHATLSDGIELEVEVYVPRHHPGPFPWDDRMYPAINTMVADASAVRRHSQPGHY